LENLQQLRQTGMQLVAIYPLSAPKKPFTAPGKEMNFG